MLVLTRERDQRVVIVVPPSDTPVKLEVTVADLLGSKARIGFDAPAHVSIDRKEVYDSKQRDLRNSRRVSAVHGEIMPR